MQEIKTKYVNLENITIYMYMEKTKPDKISKKK